MHDWCHFLSVVGKDLAPRWRVHQTDLGWPSRFGCADPVRTARLASDRSAKAFTFLIDRLWPAACRIVGVNGDLTWFPQPSLGATMILDLIAGVNGAGQPVAGGAGGTNSELWQSIVESLEAEAQPEPAAESGGVPEREEKRKSGLKSGRESSCAAAPQVPAQWAPPELPVRSGASGEAAGEDVEAAREALPHEPAPEADADRDSSRSVDCIALSCTPGPRRPRATAARHAAAEPAVDGTEPAHSATPVLVDRRAELPTAEQSGSFEAGNGESAERDRADQRGPALAPDEGSTDVVAGPLVFASPAAPRGEDSFLTPAAPPQPRSAANAFPSRACLREEPGMQRALPAAELPEQAQPIMGMRLRASGAQAPQSTSKTIPLPADAGVRALEPLDAAAPIRERRPAEASDFSAAEDQPPAPDLDRTAQAMRPESAPDATGDTWRRTERRARESAPEEPRQTPVREVRVDGQRPVPTAGAEAPTLVRAGSLELHPDQPDARELPAILSHEPVEDAKPDGSRPGVSEIRLKLDVPQSDPVHVKFTERGGEVHVLVRSNQTGAASQLTADLRAFHENLATRGVEAETWLATPHDIDANPSSGGDLNETGEASAFRGPAESAYTDPKGQSGGHQRGGRTWPDWLELLSEHADEAALRRFRKGMNTWRQ